MLNEGLLVLSGGLGAKPAANRSKLPPCSRLGQEGHAKPQNQKPFPCYSCFLAVRGSETKPLIKGASDSWGLKIQAEIEILHFGSISNEQGSS